jgi:hypothetical protein
MRLLPLLLIAFLAINLKMAMAQAPSSSFSKTDKVNLKLSKDREPSKNEKPETGFEGEKNEEPQSKDNQFGEVSTEKKSNQLEVISLQEKHAKRNELINRAVDLETSIYQTLGMAKGSLVDANQLKNSTFDRPFSPRSNRTLDSIMKNLASNNRTGSAYRNLQKASVLRTQLKSCLTQINTLNDELGYPRSDYSIRSYNKAEKLKKVGLEVFGLTIFEGLTEKVKGVTVNIGDPQITLIWDSLADLDLHVIEPGGSEIYWEIPEGKNFGVLDIEDLDGIGPENVFWKKGTAQKGEYSWWVNYYGDSSGSKQPTNWQVRVKRNGKAEAFSGTLKKVDENSPRQSFFIR